MFDTSWIADLDADGACRAVAGTQQDLREAEWRELALAAHWADLHDEQTIPVSAGPVLAGLERAVRLGGDGTPLVAEFACAELAVLMGIGCVAAEHLVRDALDLRHRHPVLWAALGAGRGRVWKARRVARMTHDARLTLEQARVVDAAVAPYVDALAFRPFTNLVEAKIVEADPAAAEARRVAEALSRFVSTGQSDEFGLKTLIVKANAGDVIFFVAMCDRIAACLAADGDTDPVDVRRSKAVGILAQPALALALLQRHAAVAPADADEPLPDEPPARRAAAPATRGRSRSTRTSSARTPPCSSGSPRSPSPPGPGWRPATSASSRCSRSGTCSGTAGSRSGRCWTSATSCRSTPTRCPRLDAGGLQAEQALVGVPLLPHDGRAGPRPHHPLSSHRTEAVHRGRPGSRTSDR